MRRVPASADAYTPLCGDRLQIFDQGPHGGFDGRYRLDGDVLNDPRSSDAELRGAYRLVVEIGEGSLTFTLIIDRGATDPWFLSTWQVAPFVIVD